MTALPYTFDPLPISSDFEALILESIADSAWAEVHRPLPEMTDTELHAFHQRAATLAFRYREFFTGASMKCSRSATPVPTPGTLAGLMQSGRTP